MSSAAVDASLPIVITGPTASGKGALAFELALRLGGEILSLDSMKLYRELDVGTAKPGPERRERVVYHLLDVLDPAEDFSVAQYLELLDRAVAEVRARGRVPVLAGGTPLYLKAFLEGLQSGPEADWAVRQRLVAEAEEHGTGWLHERLQRVDPQAAGKIHVRDLRRLVRALEVVERTGRPLSERWQWSQQRPAASGTRCFALDWERASLYRRIDLRVERMVAGGLLEEARRLLERQPPPGRTASQSIGYKEVWAGLSAGESVASMVAAVQRHTRRLAKSQLTWLRGLPLEWLPVTESTSVAALADEVMARLSLPARPTILRARPSV